MLGKLGLQNRQILVPMGHTLGLQNDGRTSRQVIADHPYAGRGLGYYAYFNDTPKIGVIPPHNMYLHTAAEIGLIGMLLFLIAVFIFFKSGMTTLRAKGMNIRLLALAGIAGLFAVMAHGMLELGAPGHMKFTWVYFLGGLLTALSVYQEPRHG